MIAYDALGVVLCASRTFFMVSSGASRVVKMNSVSDTCIYILQQCRCEK